MRRFLSVAPDLALGLAFGAGYYLSQGIVELLLGGFFAGSADDDLGNSGIVAASQ